MSCRNPSVAIKFAGAGGDGRRTLAKLTCDAAIEREMSGDRALAGINREAFSRGAHGAGGSGRGGIRRTVIVSRPGRRRRRWRPDGAARRA